MIRWRHWVENLLQRLRSAAGKEPHEDRQSTEARAQFWKEFRAGQREADERVIAAAERPHPARR